MSAPTADEIFAKVRIPSSKIFGETGRLLNGGPGTATGLHYAGQAQAKAGFGVENLRSLGSEGLKMVVRKPGEAAVKAKAIPKQRRTSPNGTKRSKKTEL